MSVISAFAVAKLVLLEDLSMDAEEALRRARTLGAEHPDSELRHAIRCTRGMLKAQADGRWESRPAPSAARSIRKPPAKTPSSSPVVEQPSSSAMFPNLTRVDAVVSACGGVENVRDLAEAIRACGSVDAFLQHLDLVAGIRSPDNGQ